MNLLVYLIKVVLVSGILFGYYRLFLRNRSFHHYNRFYLLCSMVLALLLPFVRIPIGNEPGNIVHQMLYTTVDAMAVDIEEPAGNVPETANPSAVERGILLLYGAGLLFLLSLVCQSLYYIYRLKRRYPAERIATLRFYNTREPGTPFSFFRSVFWNEAMPFHTPEGQQIFRHELFHVRQYHSADRMLAEVLTAIFWFNPFFHWMKKELKTIHEFLADAYAVSGSDRYEYAALLVQQTLDQRKHQLTNHFFQNHIKRRIAMITQFKNSRYGYWSRVMVLPLSVLLFFTVALHAKAPADAPVIAGAGILPEALDAPVQDTIPEKERREKVGTVRERQIREKTDDSQKRQEKELKSLKKQRAEKELQLQKMSEQQEKRQKETAEKMKAATEQQQRLREAKHIQKEAHRKVLKEKQQYLQERQDKENAQALQQRKYLQRRERSVEQKPARNELLRTQRQLLKERELELKKMHQQQLLELKKHLQEVEIQQKKMNELKLEQLKEQLKRQEEIEKKRGEMQSPDLSGVQRSSGNNDRGAANAGYKKKVYSSVFSNRKSAVFHTGKSAVFKSGPSPVFKRPEAMKRTKSFTTMKKTVRPKIVPAKKVLFRQKPVRKENPAKDDRINGVFDGGETNALLTMRG